TVRALKSHGGVKKADLEKENLEALEAGLPNLLRHIENITGVFKLPAVVAINAFPKDTKEELLLVERRCKELGVNVAVSEVWAKGGEGGEKLASEVVKLAEPLAEPADRSGAGQSSTPEFVYDLNLPIKEKIEAIAKKIYRAEKVSILPNAQKQIEQLQKQGLDKVPICMAKTQYSFSDDPALLGAPKGFTLTVRDLKISAGAGFIVALTGDIMTMPGLPAVPSSEKIDVDNTGKISGLF
ncbi:MAG: formate--tetrahydrofolate ligase, partial [Treponema sp.]|nr:formate--tetrahydrofolate ligase [Treponema sp.]